MSGSVVAAGDEHGPLAATVEQVDTEGEVVASARAGDGGRGVQDEQKTSVPVGLGDRR